MREELLEYYVRELTYLRQMGAEFSRKYPGVAGRLLLEPDDCGDPHVERLLESVAFLSARVHRRIDDDFPELSESLLDIIQPSYLRPLPSMTIVECLPDPSHGKKTAGMSVPRETQLVSKAVVDQLACKFRTAYDVDLWPFSVDAAEWRLPERIERPARTSSGAQAVAVARLHLKCLQDVTFEGLSITKLRFHLSGEPNVAYPLCELLSEKCVEIQLRDPKQPKTLIVLDPSRIRMVGFGSDENILPKDHRSTDGYRLLQEYFAFPEKFLFFDLEGLEALSRSGFGNEAEILFLFSKFERPDRQQDLELGVNARTFRLGCTPAINLFEQTADPIQLTQTKHEYTIIPEGRHVTRMEVFSIQEVIAANPRLRRSVSLEPMHTYRHQTRSQEDQAFWKVKRNANQIGEREPSVMTISVVDVSGHMTDPEADVLTVRTLCTNFDLPTRLPDLGNDMGDFDAVGCAAAKKVTAIKRPTASIDVPEGRGHTWRLISMLSLNYLSLNEGGRGALQEILRLHSFKRNAAIEGQISGIRTMKSSPHFAMVQSAYGLVPARGTLVELDLDEQLFAGGGAHLFTAVLDRFFAGYCSVNSFTQLVARTSLRKEEIARWPPRAGNQVLL